MKSLQEKVAEFAFKNNLEAMPEIRMLDLCSEVGELAKEVVKATNYSKQAFVKTEKMEDEMGDVLFSLICLANSLDVDLKMAVENSLKKYEVRMNNNGDAGSGMQDNNV